MSVEADLQGRGDGLIDAIPLLDRLGGRFADLLDRESDSEVIVALRAAESLGRPLGSPPS